MFTSFCTILGYVIVGGVAIVASGVAIAALFIGLGEIFSRKD